MARQYLKQLQVANVERQRKAAVTLQRYVYKSTISSFPLQKLQSLSNIGRFSLCNVYQQTLVNSLPPDVPQSKKDTLNSPLTQCLVTNVFVHYIVRYHPQRIRQPLTLTRLLRLRAPDQTPLPRIIRQRLHCTRIFRQHFLPEKLIAKKELLILQ